MEAEAVPDAALIEVAALTAFLTALTTTSWMKWTMDNEGTGARIRSSFILSYHAILNQPWHNLIIVLDKVKIVLVPSPFSPDFCTRTPLGVLQTTKFIY